MTTIREGRDRWLSERYRSREIGQKSFADLRARFRDLEAIHGDRPLSELDRKTVQRWSRQIGHLSPATRRAYLSTIGGFCRWAVAEGMLEVDPTEALPRIKEPRRVPRARSQSDVARILAAAPDARGRLIIMLMVSMGLRCIEVARLEVDDYDRQAQTMLIRGKRDNERMLPVPEQVIEAVELYRDPLGWRAGPLVCAEMSSHRAITTHYVSHVVTALMYRSGVKKMAGDGIGAHALRHTAGSDVLDACNNVRTVQEMLGHRSLATTQIYLRRASLSQLRTAMSGRTYGTLPRDDTGEP